MKVNRRSKIIELVKNFDIETQEDLTERLKQSGFDVTQATVSRDIRDLKLLKVSGPDGRQKYAVLASVDEDNTNRFKRIFCEGVVSLDFAGNILVIKTLQGLAMAIGASLDFMNFGEIIGTIAGDDTLMCVVRTESDAQKIIAELKALLQSRSS